MASNQKAPQKKSQKPVPKNTKKKGGKKRKKKNNKPSLAVQIVYVVLFIAFIITAVSLNDQQNKEETTLTLSQVATEIQAENVKEIVVRGESLEITLNDEEETQKESKKERGAALTETLVNYGITAEQLASVDIVQKNETGVLYWIANLLPIIVPLLILGVIFWFMSAQLRGSGMKAFSFGQSKARVILPNGKKRITFDDVAGNGEAKQELEEFVDFLKNPKKYLEIGAKIPKGILLAGEPGTGKTLLARAVAGEAQVPFFHLSGSEFVEMFVGVGASRVRSLFQQAKQASPAIVFIDEIDAVGRSRGVGVGGGNDEREQTLNQILVEMDGFEPADKVIVMAATNRVDVLDKALLRPGRFDRRVMLDMPDRKDRTAILKIHAKKKKVSKDINFESVAARTPGFSGADLESLMNEAAIKAARENRKQVEQDDLLDVVDKVLIGPKRKSHLHNSKERELVAYHEAGHALVATALPNADPVHRVSIIPRGSAGGYTLKLPYEERKLGTKSHYIDDLAMTLGGYAAEEIILGETTTGPSSDLRHVASIARAMVTRWGMSEKVGTLALKEHTPGLMEGGDGLQVSDQLRQTVDAEVKRIVDDALATARKVVQEHKQVLDIIAQALLKDETLEEDEFNKLVEPFNFPNKRKQHHDSKEQKLNEEAGVIDTNHVAQGKQKS